MAMRPQSLDPCGASDLLVSFEQHIGLYIKPWIRGDDITICFADENFKISEIYAVL